MTPLLPTAIIDAADDGAAVIRHDARNLPLPDDSVDCLITSPPYFALRSYRDDAGHYDGQIGSEDTPDMFLDALDECMVEWRRVLKPGGSCWVNLGDKYAGSDGTPGGASSSTLRGQARAHKAATGHRPNSTIRPKSLMGLPWRFAIRQIDAGWILRAEVIWCLSGGVRLYARANGTPRTVMLRDLYRAYRPQSVELWNGEKWTQVLGWSETPRPDSPIELRLRSGEWITCTPNHQWPTRRGLLRADEVRVGDVIDSVTLPDEKPHASGLAADDVGWLVGLYLAEGSRSGTMLQFAGHVNETTRHARLARIADAYDGTCNVYQTDENGATCNLSGSVLVGIIDRYVAGSSAKTKHLTQHVWNRSNAFLASIMQGYLEGDGHYDAKNDRWRLGFTRNADLAADLRTLGARLGASVRLNKSHAIAFGRQWPTYRGQWRWEPSDHHNTAADTEVVAIARGRARHFYDIGVEDKPHVFALASGVLTHNSKPNGLPESVTDRVRRSHEQWFHLVKSPRYFSAVDEIRAQGVPGNFVGVRPSYFLSPSGVAICQECNGRIKTVHLSNQIGPDQRRQLKKGQGADGDGGARPVGAIVPLLIEGDVQLIEDGSGLVEDGVVAVVDHEAKDRAAAGSVSESDAALPVDDPGEPSKVCMCSHVDTHSSTVLGRLPGSVWTVPTEPLIIPDEVRKQRDLPDHFAAFPQEFPRRIILGWSPSGICVACGEGRKPVVEKTKDVFYGEGKHRSGAQQVKDGAAEVGWNQDEKWRTEASITGYTCACPTPDAPTRPAVILDPFGGTGTVAGVARQLGRYGITNDLSAAYNRLATWRIWESGHFGKAEQRMWAARQGNLL